MTTPHWTAGVLYSFDIESTSADPLTAHVVSATLAKLDGGEYVDDRSWLVKPAVPIPAEATEIHGITNEHVEEFGTDPRAALEEIVTMLAQVLRSRRVLVVFNAAYDLTMVEKQCEYYGIPGLRERLEEHHWETVIDPFVLGKGVAHYHLQKFEKGRKFTLPALCSYYGVDFEESHDAKADAVGAGKLAVALVTSAEFLSTRGPKAMHQLQRIWRTKAQNSLREYFDKKAIEHDGVDAGWPLHTALSPARS